MRKVRLGSTALWEVVRRLPEKVFEAVGFRVQGTRTAWVLETLRAWENYSDEALREAYKRTFPEANADLLKVYKRLLWDALEEILSTQALESLAVEVRIWRRLWASVRLWQWGHADIAETLWRQAVHEAIAIGWFEVALWAISLLEVYVRDFHRAAIGEEVSRWTQQLLKLVQARYEAVSQKIAATEAYIQTRTKGGWRLPPLPQADPWSAYMQSYKELLLKAQASAYTEALSVALSMGEVLLEEIPFPPLYKRFHLALTWTNIGILLVNLRQAELYEKWYETWQFSKNKGFWPMEERYEALHRVVLAIRIGYLVQRGDWEAIRQVWLRYGGDLEKHIFQGSENLGFRVSTALNIYLMLVLTAAPASEVRAWRQKVEAWIERERFRDSEYLWWLFLRWYETYRSGDKRWMQYAYRQLRTEWHKRFAHDTRWAPVLAWLRSLTEGLRSTQRRRAIGLLRRWRDYPQEGLLWENDSVFFPLKAFVEATLKRMPLERFPIPPPTPFPLPEERKEQVAFLLNSFTHKVGT